MVKPLPALETLLNKPLAIEEYADFPKRFQEELKRRRTDRGRGKRFPRDLQTRAVAYYHYRLAEGSFLSEVARELEVPAPTLRRWVLDTPAPAGIPVPTWQPPRRVADAARSPALATLNADDMATLVDLLRKAVGRE